MEIESREGARRLEISFCILLNVSLLHQVGVPKEN